LCLRAFVVKKLLEYQIRAFRRRANDGAK